VQDSGAKEPSEGTYWHSSFAGFFCIPTARNLTGETNRARFLGIFERRQTEEAKFGLVQSNEANSYLTKNGRG
jgi:hypothetical protein